MLRPRKSAKGGCISAASFISDAPSRKTKARTLRPAPLLRNLATRLAPRLRNDADVWPRCFEALWPEPLGFFIAHRAGNNHVFALFPVGGRSNAVLGGHLQ